jgi:hypothetical protein
VNTVLDDYQKGRLSHVAPKGELPQHINFI